jgi:hypothetical protein
MKEYKVTGKVVGFNTGDQLLLSEKQYQARKHALEPVKGKKNLYSVLSRIEFKNGEIFGYSGEFGKAALESVIDINAKQEPAKSAEAKISDKELIARAEELGIKKPGRKSREELLHLIAEAEAEKIDPIGSDITDPDGEGVSLDSLDEQELIVLAKELGFENAESMDKVELIDAITKATAGDAK